MAAAKGHVGVSWWEASPGRWHVAASALGCKPHSDTVEGDETLAKKTANDLLLKATADAELCPKST